MSERDRAARFVVDAMLNWSAYACVRCTTRLAMPTGLLCAKCTVLAAPPHTGEKP